MRPSVCAVLLCVVVTLRVGAQNAPDSTSVRPGDRVRMQMPGDARWSVTGHVYRLSPDSLRLVRDEGDTVSIDRSRISLLEARRGVELQTRVIATTTLVGLFAGGVTAVVMCANDRAACAAEEQARQRADYLDQPYVSRELILGGAGAVVGALLGWAIAPPPQWEAAVLPVVELDVDRTGYSRFGLGLRCSF